MQRKKVARDVHSEEQRRGPKSAKRNVMLALFVLPFALGVSGCSATFMAGPPTVSGYEVAEARAVPVDIERYPHVAYNGQDAYLVGGLWYYPTATG